MSAAQELFELLKDARPSPNMERKPLPKPQPKAATLTPMAARIPPKRVELPALGGLIEIEYEWEVDR